MARETSAESNANGTITSLNHVARSLMSGKRRNVTVASACDPHSNGALASSATASTATAKQKALGMRSMRKGEKRIQPLRISRKTLKQKRQSRFDRRFFSRYGLLGSYLSLIFEVFLIKVVTQWSLERFVPIFLSSLSHFSSRDLPYSFIRGGGRRRQMITFS